MFQEVIAEVEEEAADKKQQITDKELTRKVSSMSRTTSTEFGTATQGTSSKNENPSLPETDKTDRSPNKFFKSATETMSQIHKKQTESDNINGPPIRMCKSLIYTRFSNIYHVSHKYIYTVS